MAIHNSITGERVTEMVERDDNEGICTACGEDASGVEPDARNYECETCGAHKVFGAEELLFVIGG
jgi:Zn finger protein HypA/HybF involved in hydrogenase expression